MTTPKNVKNSDLISLNEAAKILQKSIKTVRRYTQTGRLDKIMSNGVYGEEIRLYKRQVMELSGLQPLPIEQENVHSFGESPQMSTGQPLPNTELALNNEGQGLDISTTKNREGDYNFLKAQLEEAKEREKRLWQEKEDAVKKWWEQFEYNKNLLTERKLLTEGEQKLKDQIHQEKVTREQDKVTHEQEKRGLVEQHEKDKTTLQHQLETAYKSKLRKRNLALAFMGIAILLPLIMGTSLFLLHRGGVIQIPLLTKITAASPDTTAEASDLHKKKDAPKSEETKVTTAETPPKEEGSNQPLTTPDSTPANPSNPTPQ